MAINLTKLTNAEYQLDGIREAIDGDNAIKPSDPTAYYTASGNPPGVWIGSAARLLGGTPGTTASSRTVRSLINERRDPSTGRYLGDTTLADGDSGRAPVAGFDLTTRQPKSVSILWAFSDADTRRRIDQCLDRAAQMTIDYFEHAVASTRAGQAGVASVACDGVAGFVFDHYDSRDGDPQPHKHIVISNRVRRSQDGVWTALDGRKVYASAVEISEYHENLLQDLLTKEFGWAWTTRPARGTQAVIQEVDGVPQELIDAFSGRHSQIQAKVDQRVRQEEQQTGRKVGPRRRAQIDLEVWRETRKAKPKIQPSLDEKRRHWYDKLGRVAPGIQIDTMLRDVNARHDQPITVDAAGRQDAARLLIAQLADREQVRGGAGAWLDMNAERATEAVSQAHTTWKATNIRAESQRLLRTVRLDPTQRLTACNAIADEATSRCVKLTPTRYRLPDGAAGDPTIALHDGRTVFDDPELDKYTTQDILDAEQLMIDAFDRPQTGGYAPGAGKAWLTAWSRQAEQEGGHPLAADQLDAAAYALENPRLAGAIIGPAGTGKTTTMNAVTRAWEAAHGPGSILGLATSHKAVNELHASIGCQSMTIARLLAMSGEDDTRDQECREHELIQRLTRENDPRERIRLRIQLAGIHASRQAGVIKPGQLVIIDEAGMVDTRVLARITGLAAQAGAKIIMTGDPKQLDSVSGAGGMLGWADRHDACRRLSSIWRFTAKPDKWARDPQGAASARRWAGESQATLRLRDGGDPLDEASVKACRALVAQYAAHDRIHWGEDPDIEETAYRMCIGWQRIGKTTLLIAGTNEQVRDINRRFILERRAAGKSEADPDRLMELMDGLSVGAGDQIVCRVNDHDIRSHDGRSIENGMTFRILDTSDGATARVKSLDDGSIWDIPRGFLKTGCKAGYAATIHGSQGMTVDRCAALFPAQASLTCNLQYVAGTRGREENHFLYGCEPEEQRRTDHMLTGAETDPRRIALDRMEHALLTHPETLTATETRDMETRNRYDLKRLIHEHDYAAGLIAGPHLLAMLAKTHDQATVEKIKRSPSFEWLRGTWSRAWTADPKRALAIIARPPDARRHTTGIDRTRSLACQAARTLLAGRTPGEGTGTRITITLDAEADTIGMLTGMLDDTGIGHTANTTPDGRTGISVETRDTPALKAMLDTWMQCRDDISPDRIDGWATLRATAHHETRQDPELARKARPTEPDWAATIAGRLNAGLLDKTNGSVHDDWVGGVIPPIKTSKHSQALDLVRQNERLIERKTRTLAQEAKTSGEAWVRPVLQATSHDPSLLRDIAVYRAMWDIDDPDTPLGGKPPATCARQTQHWANLNGRLNHTTCTAKPHGDTRDHPYRRHTTDARVEQHDPATSNTRHADRQRSTPWQTKPQPSSTPSPDGLSL